MINLILSVITIDIATSPSRNDSGINENLSHFSAICEDTMSALLNYFYVGTVINLYLHPIVKEVIRIRADSSEKNSAIVDLTGLSPKESLKRRVCYVFASTLNNEFTNHLLKLAKLSAHDISFIAVELENINQLFSSQSGYPYHGLFILSSLTRGQDELLTIYHIELLLSFALFYLVIEDYQQCNRILAEMLKILVNCQFDYYLIHAAIVVLQLLSYNFCHLGDFKQAVIVLDLIIPIVESFYQYQPQCKVDIISLGKMYLMCNELTKAVGVFKRMIERWGPSTLDTNLLSLISDCDNGILYSKKLKIANPYQLSAIFCILFTDNDLILDTFVSTGDFTYLHAIVMATKKMLPHESFSVPDLITTLEKIATVIVEDHEANISPQLSAPSIAPRAAMYRARQSDLPIVLSATLSATTDSPDQTADEVTYTLEN